VNGTPIHLDPWFQGPTGSGQGGWTAHRMQQQIDPQVTFALRRPIPLATDLFVRAVDDAWHLVTADDEPPVMIATEWEPSFAKTTAVSIADATAAATGFPLTGDLHPVPECFSCGLEPDSMQVHSGPLGDGRWATDWQAPTWAVNADGTFDDAALWAAIDCAAAWYAGCEGGIRRSVTAQYAVEVRQPIQPGETYALVAWAGDYDPEWDGRKRGAASAAFDASGACVALARSFWIALES